MSDCESPFEIYGLIGYPLKHSFSKAFFTDKFRRERVNADYRNYELEDIESLRDILSGNASLKGFNVTIPYKKAIIGLLDEIDEEAARVGAVNTVKICAGRLKGYNTDVHGFVESIRPYILPRHKKALVLGTGGASAAVCFGLEKLGLEHRTVSRTKCKADFTYDELTPELIGRFQVIVNATPLGTFPVTDACPDIPYEGIDSRHLCMDLVYNPAETLFLKKAASNGAATLNGLEMLHLQAEKAWEIWQKDDF